MGVLESCPGPYDFRALVIRGDDKKDCDDDPFADLVVLKSSGWTF